MALNFEITSFPLTATSVVDVVLVEITTPSLLHSRVGTGEPLAAHWSMTVSYSLLTVIKGGGAVVMTGDPRR